MYSKPEKPRPRINSSLENGYIINDSCGFYHAGSKSKLYDKELYEEAPAIPPKMEGLEYEPSYPYSSIHSE